MKKLLLILFIPFIVNSQQIKMDAVVLKDGSDAEYGDRRVLVKNSRRYN